VSGDAFDRASWERRWAQVIREQPEMVAGRPPSAYVVDEIDAMGPGRALDAGCGHGAEAIGLAASGWQVTAVDFSPSALEHGRTTAAAVGADVSARIEWIEADLGTWAPPPRRFDLVSCLYVHAARSVREMVARLATGVAPGATLLLVGHSRSTPRPVDRAPRRGRCR
jgi:SAM-dependent methyltransferase